MRLLFLAVLLVGSGASAQGAGDASSDASPSATSPGEARSGSSSTEESEAFRELPRAPEASLPPFGVSLDVGLPDFAGLSFNWRPIWLLRLHGGVLFNGVAPGARAGITLIPFNFVVTPTLSAEAGYYFGADASYISEALPIDQSEGGAMREVLKDLQYSFASAHIGFEVGAPSSFLFYLRAGLSYVDTTLHGSGAAVEEQVGDPNLSVDDFKLRGTIPSVKLGFLFYFG